MTTDIDYALMAGAAYRSTRDAANRLPVPSSSGWSEIPGTYRVLKESGFEAISFTNGNEIVISYSGTDPNDANPVTSPDGKTNVDLAAGVWAEQLLQAAEYYLQVKSAPESAGKTITLTGHSLGGGLAALVGVFFEVQAKTFDQAPFAASALDKSGNNAGDLYALLAAKSDGSSAPELAKLSGYLQLRSRGGNNFIPREELITTIRVEGEFLAGGLFGNHSFGNPDKLLSHGPPRGGLLEGGFAVVK